MAEQQGASRSGGEPGDRAGEASSGPQPIGRYLRLQREMRGISIDELATATRIPLRSLERLEDGTFDDLSDGFVRGFVRTVAQALGLDAEDTLSRMLTEPGLEETEERDLSLAFSRALVGLLLVVLLAGAVALVQAVVRSASGPSAPAEVASEQVLRRDPVRALAESMAASEGTQDTAQAQRSR